MVGQVAEIIMEQSDSSWTPVGLLVCRDLFFTSKVTGTAHELSFSIETVGDQEAAHDRVARGSIRGVFVDLALPNFDLARFMAHVAAGNRPRVLAFGSHVATAQLQAARDAGCDEVLPRSRFSAELPQLLQRFLSGPGPAAT
jgi:CheY-like chemotaxis protein